MHEVQSAAYYVRPVRAFLAGAPGRGVGSLRETGRAPLVTAVLAGSVLVDEEEGVGRVAGGVVRTGREEAEDWVA